MAAPPPTNPITSLDALARIPLPDLGTAGGKTSVKRSHVETDKARRLYQSQGYVDLPEIYTFSTTPFSRAYRTLYEFENYAERLNATPNEGCKTEYSNHLNEKEKLEDTQEVAYLEAAVQRSIDKVVVSVASAITAQLLSGIKGKKVKLHVDFGQAQKADISISYFRGQGCLMMLEVKRLVDKPGSWIELIDDLRDVGVSGPIEHEDDPDPEYDPDQEEYDRRIPAILVSKVRVCLSVFRF